MHYLIYHCVILAYIITKPVLGNFESADSYFGDFPCNVLFQIFLIMFYFTYLKSLRYPKLTALSERGDRKSVEPLI